MALGITVEFNAEMVKFSQQLDKIGGQMDRFRASAERTSADIGAALSKIGGGIAFGALAADILATNRAMESLRTQMESVTGSAEGGARAFDFVKKFAVETPFAIEGLSKSFITLKNLGITPTAEVMTALTNQASKLGASQETLEAIVLQLGQAYSKGKLQQEDMVILAERGVPIYELAAQALNKTGNEIAEMSKKGEMGRDAIDAIIKKMGELSEGSNARAMDTLNGKISQLSDAWVNFQDTLLNDKSEGLIKNIVSGATSALSQLTQVLSSDLDAQIATLEQKLAYRDFGAIGKTVYSLTNPVDAQQDMRGNDANDRELKRLKALKVERDKLSKESEIKAKSADAVKQTQSWLDELEQTPKKTEKAAAGVKTYRTEVDLLTKSLTDANAKLAAQRPDNLLQLENITATPQQQAELRRKALTQKNIEFDKANKTGNLADAARIAQEREQLAFENAKEDLYGVRSGELPSYKAFDAKQNYNKAVADSKKAFDRFQATGQTGTAGQPDATADGSKPADAKPGTVDGKTDLATQISQAEQLKKLLTDLEKPFKVTVESNIQDTIKQADELQQKLNAISTGIAAANDATSGNAGNVNQALSTEVLKRGSRT